MKIFGAQNDECQCHKRTEQWPPQTQGEQPKSWPRKSDDAQQLTVPGK